MNNEFMIDTKVGYNKMLFTKKNNKLDLLDNFDLLAAYPIKINLLKVNDYEDESKNELVATIVGYYFDLDYMREEKISLFEIFDGIDQNIFDMYTTLFDKEEYKSEFDVINENLFYLDTIFIEENYRCEGLCKMIVEQLYDILRYILKLNVGVIATSIYPYETTNHIDSIESLSSKEKENLNNKLLKLFKDNHYKESNSDNNYLVRIF